MRAKEKSGTLMDTLKMLANVVILFPTLYWDILIQKGSLVILSVMENGLMYFLSLLITYLHPYTITLEDN